MPENFSVKKILSSDVPEIGSSSYVNSNDVKQPVSVYGTKIVNESTTEISATPLSESPAKEAFKHFGKKYDDLAMMDTNNTTAKLQMQLDDFAAEYPNAKLPKLPNIPDPAKFEKGKDGYQAYKMALMQYENVCSNKIENAARKAITTTVRESAAETQDVVRSTAKETQMVTIDGVEYLAEKIDESTSAIIANSEEEFKQLEKQINAMGGKIISVVRQESGKIRVQIKERADGIENKMDTQHNDEVEYNAALSAYNARTNNFNSNVRTTENVNWGGNTLNLISRQNLPTPIKTKLVKVLTNVMTQEYLSEAEKEHMIGRIKEECANAGVPYQE